MGGSGAITVDATWSPNDDIEDLSGIALSTGAGGQWGVAASGEVNLPADPCAKASYTGSVGGGIGVPIEMHGFISNTKVNVIWNSR